MFVAYIPRSLVRMNRSMAAPYFFLIHLRELSLLLIARTYLVRCKPVLGSALDLLDESIHRDPVVSLESPPCRQRQREKSGLPHKSTVPEIEKCLAGSGVSEVCVCHFQTCDAHVLHVIVQDPFEPGFARPLQNRSIFFTRHPPSLRVQGLGFRV